MKVSQLREGGGLDVELLKAHHHACLVYSTTTEQLESIVPFVEAGLKRHELCLYIVDENRVEDIENALQKAGVDVAAFRESGLLRILKKEDTCLEHGPFDQKAVLKELESFIDRARRTGIECVRVAVEMSWMLGNSLPEKQILEFEKALNLFYPKHEVLGVCQYNRSLFPPEMIQALIETHAVIISHGIVNENRFWIQPCDCSGRAGLSAKVDRMLAQLEDATKQNTVLRERERQLESMVGILKASEERFHLAQEAANAGIYDIVWKDGKPSLSVDERIKSLWGVGSAVNMDMDRFLAHIFKEDHDEIQKALNRAMREGPQARYYVEYHVLHAEKNVVQWVADYGIIAHKDGVLQRRLGVVLDISDRKRAMTELSKAESMTAYYLRFSESLMAAIPMPLFYKNREGRFLGCNKAFTEGTGLSHIQILGKTTEEIWPSQSGGLYKSKDDLALQHPNETHTYEACVEHGKGGYRNMVFAKRAFMGPDGEVGGIIGACFDLTEQKQAETSLKLLSRAIDEAMEGVMIAGTHEAMLPTLYVNRGFENLTGYAKEEVYGKNLRCLLGPGTDMVLIKKLYDNIVQEKAITLELLCYRKNGEPFWNHVSYAPVSPDEFGQKYAVFVFADVTEMHQTMESLKESEERYRTVIEHSNDLIWTMDCAGRITFGNKRCEEVLGYLTESVIGKSSSLFCPKEDLQRQHEIFQSILAGVPQHYEAFVIRNDGGRRLLFISSAPIYKEGKIVGMVAFGSDMTQQREIEKALRISEERFRLVAQACNDGIWDFDMVSRMVWYNERYRQMLGAEPPDSLGYEWWVELVHPEDRGDVVDKFQEAIYARRDYVSLDYRVVTPNGRLLYVTNRAYVVRNASGQAIRILGAVMDMTPYRQAQEELRKLSVKLVNLQEEERRRIAREMHDSTAQRLTGLIMTLEKLEESKNLTDAIHLGRECLEAAKESAQEIRTLSYLLHPPLLEELGLEAALDTYITGFAKRSGIKMTFEVQGDMRDMPKDIATALFRIVQEGIGNIHRHSQSPTASVLMARLKKRVVLEVIDQGRGIPQPLLESLKTRHQGTGVGMVGMMERIEQLGGALEIESSNQGTCVRAIVPIPGTNSSNG